MNDVPVTTITSSGNEHKPLGRAPVNLLLLNSCSSISCFMLLTVGGNGPLKLLSYKYRYFKLDIDPMDKGTGPVRELSLSAIPIKLVSSPIAVGIELLRLL